MLTGNLVRCLSVIGPLRCMLTPEDKVGAVVQLYRSGLQFGGWPADPVGSSWLAALNETSLCLPSLSLHTHTHTRTHKQMQVNLRSVLNRGFESLINYSKSPGGGGKHRELSIIV